MSFMSRLAASIGVGRCRVSVAAADPQQFRGGPVRGIVLLEADAAEQDVRMLTVDLTEFWVTGTGKNRSHHQRNHGRVTAAENVKVAPGFRQEYPFEMWLPADARCTRRREGWTLNAEAHILMAVDARAYTVLKVLPHPEILAVQRCARDAFGLIPSSWDGSRPAVLYDFAAPPWLQIRLDGVAFRLEVVGDLVTGEMILNKQEHGVGGVLRAMVGGDRESIPISVPRSDLRTRRGSPNPAGARSHIRALFERAGIDVPVDGQSA